MPIPTYGESGRPSKFGFPTRTFSMKLPIHVIEKIREKRMDIGQIVFDIVENELDPYSINLIGDQGLLRKLILVFMELEIDTGETNVIFTDEERSYISKTAQELAEGI